MKDARTWWPISLIALAALVVPGVVAADLVCTAYEVTPVTALAAGELVELVISTLLWKGVALVLVGATAVVSLPWLVAGGAAATCSAVPQWIKLPW
jgi:hypothetical protein